MYLKEPYLAGVYVESIKKIERDGSQEVHDEPSLEVIEGDGAALWDHLTLFAHESRAEVEDYI